MTISLNSIVSGQILGPLGPTGPGGNDALRISDIVVSDSNYDQLRSAKVIENTGGYLKITGVGFSANASVYFNNTRAATVTQIDSTQLNVVVPVLSVGSYSILVENSDGSSTMRPNLLTVGLSPSWTTAANLGNQVPDFSLNLTSENADSFSLADGSSLPAGVTLNSSTGALTGVGVTEGNYSFTLIASNSSGLSVSRTFSLSAVRANLVTGQQAYTSPGSYSWTAPQGVYLVSVVAVGGGGSGGARGTHITNGAASQGGSGGGLGWKNSIPVTPGQSYTVVVGNIGVPPNLASDLDGGAGGDSYFIDTNTVCGFGGPGGRAGSSANVGIAQPGGSYTGDGGGVGGAGGIGQSTTLSPSNPGGGGGGAGGYSGNGGAGGGADNPSVYTAGSAGSGGGGGGGSSGAANSGTRLGPGGGGGVGILGQGANGAGGAQATSTAIYGGKGGSGGANAADSTYSGSYTAGSEGALYGGGGSGSGLATGPLRGGSGAVRIIWGASGTSRAFPSTNTGDL